VQSCNIVSGSGKENLISEIAKTPPAEVGRGHYL
jgi:hypothetical protein